MATVDITVLQPILYQEAASQTPHYAHSKFIVMMRTTAATVAATTGMNTSSNGLATSDNSTDDYAKDLPPLNHNFSLLLSPMATSSVTRSSESATEQRYMNNQWRADCHSDDRIHQQRNATTAPTHSHQNHSRWNLAPTATNDCSWSRASVGVVEGRETSQHSRGGRSLSTTNSNSQNTTSNYNAGGIWGNSSGAFNSNDDFSKSSHTSTTSTFLNMAATNLEDDDGDSSNHLHHDDIVVESSGFFSSMHLRTSGFDDDITQQRNQPPKQPVRRPSYGTGYTISSNSPTDYLSLVPTSKSQDSNSTTYSSQSQPQYQSSSTPAQYYSDKSSSLQRAANANPYYPSSVTSSSSTIPGLVGAGSGSVATTKTSATMLFPHSTSSLAVAASMGQHRDMRRGSLPPPGFVVEQQQDDFDVNQRHGFKHSTVAHQQQHRKMSSSTSVVAQRGHSPPTLKDRNTNVQQSSFSLTSFYNNDTKDDLLSVTSNTTATTATSLRSYRHVESTTTSSSQAIRALMDHTTTTMEHAPLENRNVLLPLSVMAQSEPVHREPSPPILPQPVVEDYFLSIERDMERDLQRRQQLALSSNADITDNEGDESLFRAYDDEFGFMDDDNWSDGNSSGGGGAGTSRDGANTDDRMVGPTKKREWLQRMNRKLTEIPVGELDPATVPVSAVMNAWAKTKSAQGAAMVELWLKRAQEEYDSGNRRFVPTTKMYTMAGKF
jgi:hypothetical protein